MITILLFSLLENKKYMTVFRYFGINSLIVLGMHWWFTTAFFGRTFKKLFNCDPPQWTGFCSTVLTLAILACLIPFFNRYCKAFVGRKDSHPLTPHHS
jgi:fucose 4-O-acetylase-like acetyltransferase